MSRFLIRSTPTSYKLPRIKGEYSLLLLLFINQDIIYNSVFLSSQPFSKYSKKGTNIFSET